MFTSFISLYESLVDGDTYTLSFPSLDAKEQFYARLRNARSIVEAKYFAGLGEKLNADKVIQFTPIKSPNSNELIFTVHLGESKRKTAIPFTIIKTETPNPNASN